MALIITITRVNYIIININKCVRNFSKNIDHEYKKCCAILGVNEKCSKNDIKTQFLKLAKRFHPDSGSEEANTEKFNQIESAYRFLQKNSHFKSEDLEDVENLMNEFIYSNHTKPQHRRYLSYGGFGSGTPLQRQKQYTTLRAVQAANNILEYRLNKSQAEPEDKLLMDKSKPKFKHKIKTKYGFERLVEDLIQESMSKGEFNNLSGIGKPLKNVQNINPHVDFVTHKINQVLIDNGFTPEWISLQKEIRNDMSVLKDSLSMERMYLGPPPLTPNEETTWLKIIEKHKNLVDRINEKINKFNLVVPILDKQMVLVQLNTIARKIVNEGKYGVKYETKSENNTQENDNPDMFTFISSIFSRK